MVNVKIFSAYLNEDEMQILEHYIGLRETISQDLPPIGYQTAYNFINFMH